jgi:hypothetical protein
MSAPLKSFESRHVCGFSGQIIDKRFVSCGTTCLSLGCLFDVTPIPVPDGQRLDYPAQIWLVSLVALRFSAIKQVAHFLRYSLAPAPGRV